MGGQLSPWFTDPNLTSHTGMNSAPIMGQRAKRKKQKPQIHQEETKAWNWQAFHSTLKAQPEKETSASWNLGSVTVLPHERRYKDGEKTGYRPGQVFANHAPDKGVAVKFIQIIERVRTVQPNKTTSPAGKWARDMDTSPIQTDRRHRSARENIQPHQPLGKHKQKPGSSTARPW